MKPFLIYIAGILTVPVVLHLHRLSDHRFWKIPYYIRRFFRDIDALVARALRYEIRVCESFSIFAYHRQWVYEGEKYIWLERDGYQPEVYLPHYVSWIVGCKPPMGDL